jgi:hypothetical protein
MNDFIKSRTYIGGFASLTNIDSGGDFNGGWGFSTASGDEIDLIPTIDRNFGFGVLAGHREGAYAAEVSYWRTDHNATWGPNMFFATTSYGTASFQSLNVDFKRYLFTQLATQPYFSLGLSFPWLVTHQASAWNTGSGYVFSDSTIAGIGFNFGVGLEIYLGSNYSIFGNIVQRWAGYNQINGALKQPFTTQFNGQDVNLEGDGINFSVGATFGFE